MKLWSIQVLRFVAALLVVHLHAVERTQEIVGDYGILGHVAGLLGRCGVDLFFVISGLIIARTSQGLTATEFIAKRARRILPLYLLFASAWALKDAVAGTLGWRDLLATGALWPASDRMTVPLLPAGWTLCFEVLFYAGFAFTIWRPRVIWLLAGAYLVALSWRSGPVSQFVGNPIILEFLFGVIIAQAPRWRPALVGIPLGAGVLVLGAVLRWPPFGGELDFLMGRDGWIRVLTLGVPAALIVWGALQIEVPESPFTYLGDASYSLYLVHAPLVGGVALLLTRYTSLPADVVILTAVACSVIVAVRVHELFEKPMLAYLRPAGPPARSPAETRSAT
ncbi:MAG TPA: acyltransferase [Phenylobacterium sp.]|nr:acyltransferase [Phenylobacterium sp.]